LKNKKARILVVDDDTGICSTLSLFLKLSNYEVDVANTGREAIEKSKKEVYDAAFLDIRLPDMEGTKLLTALRETTPKMIKIMVTGFPTFGNAVEALKLGADDYLLKPVDPEELVKIVEKKLEEQKDAETMTENRIRGFIETRTEKLLKDVRAQTE
jgi:two-component system response regulator HydG